VVAPPTPLTLPSAASAANAANANANAALTLAWRGPAQLLRRRERA